MAEQLTTQTSNNAVIVSVQSLRDIRRNSPRYKDTAPEVWLRWLANKIAYCNMINHTRQEAEVLKVDAAALDAAMMQDKAIADLTAPEISFAMYHGVMGEYGEYYGLTPRTFMGFFREFFKTDIKYCVTQEEKKAAQPVRGDWVLQRMEHHRLQVEREREDEELRDEVDASMEGWKKNISSTLNNTKHYEQRPD